MDFKVIKARWILQIFSYLSFLDLELLEMVFKFLKHIIQTLLVFIYFILQTSFFAKAWNFTKSILSLDFNRQY